MRKYQSTPYLLSLLFIISWWSLAFSFKNVKNSPIELKEEKTLPSPLLQIHGLSPLHRDTLKEALDGNFSKMGALITAWDIDAKILQEAKIPAIRLSQEKLFQAEKLSRLLTYASEDVLTEIRKTHRKKEIKDCLGHTHVFEKPWRFVLPHPFSVAAILLAIAPSDQLLALPKGMRKHAYLFEEGRLDRIPKDLEREAGERFFFSHPDGAFVATYSHPGMLETLKHQKIPYFLITCPKDLEGILELIETCSHIIGRSLEGELLSIFVEAAFVSLDNRLSLYRIQSPSPPILFTFSEKEIALPGKQSMVTKLLKRLPFPSTTFRGEGWQEVLSEEELLDLNPKALLMASCQKDSLEQNFYQLARLGHLNAVKNKRLFFIDQTQLSYPSQHLVLAYFDIFCAFLHANEPQDTG